MPASTALFIIDPPERLDPPTDTSLALMRSAIRRGYKVFFCTLGELRLTDDRPQARAWTVGFPTDAELFATGQAVDLDLGSLSVLFMRKDPPVDAAYLHACAILDHLPATVLQVNPARALIRHGEKMIPLKFPGMMPDTLITARTEDLIRFLSEHRHMVIKPLEDCSGRGIFQLRHEDPRAAARLTEATENGRRFVQGQRFLPDIAGGDKRVLLLGGEILGWVRRLPATGDFRSNINAGGQCVPCELTETRPGYLRTIAPVAGPGGDPPGRGGYRRRKGSGGEYHQPFLPAGNQCADRYGSGRRNSRLCRNENRQPVISAPVQRNSPADAIPGCWCYWSG